MNKTDLEILESKGIETVLLEIAKGFHGSPGSPLRAEVDAWIESKRSASAAIFDSKREARDEDTLPIAKEANRIASEALSIAKRQARWDMWAAIIAIVAAIIATMAYIKTP